MSIFISIFHPGYFIVFTLCLFSAQAYFVMIIDIHLITRPPSKNVLPFHQ